MERHKGSFLERVRLFLEELFALRISAGERLRHAGDPYNPYLHDVSNRKPVQVAAILSLLLHIVFFLIVFPSWGDRVYVLDDPLLLRQLARPAADLGGGNKPEAAPPEPQPTIPEPEPILVPIPDPTPNAPEPLVKEMEDVPDLLEELAPDLNIGDIAAPPGDPGLGGRGLSEQAGQGRGPLQGGGPGTGAGGVYTIGSGVTMPEIIKQTVPSYTDDAIRSKVQGIVILQAIIRKDGRVDSFKVLRGLGYGLEEKAIQEIANNWRFRPGTLKGKPVDVLATIEVSFNLR